MFARTTVNFSLYPQPKWYVQFDRVDVNVMWLLMLLGRSQLRPVQIWCKTDIALAFWEKTNGVFGIFSSPHAKSVGHMRKFYLERIPHMILPQITDRSHSKDIKLLYLGDVAIELKRKGRPVIITKSFNPVQGLRENVKKQWFCAFWKAPVSILW